ncbi:hypothetical protein BC833DRAFT_606720 [Globomyces pollinis-pini]|nr:hypothetical protein BC833DRAFT_606720 [Globomyces pollinis-pini]
MEWKEEKSVTSLNEILQKDFVCMLVYDQIFPNLNSGITNLMLELGLSTISVKLELYNKRFVSQCASSCPFFQCFHKNEPYLNPLPRTGLIDLQNLCYGYIAKVSTVQYTDTGESYLSAIANNKSTLVYYYTRQNEMHYSNVINLQLYALAYIQIRFVIVNVKKFLQIDSPDILHLKNYPGMAFFQDGELVFNNMKNAFQLYQFLQKMYPLVKPVGRTSDIKHFMNQKELNEAGYQPLKDLVQDDDISESSNINQNNDEFDLSVALKLTKAYKPESNDKDTKSGRTSSASGRRKSVFAKNENSGPESSKANNRRRSSIAVPENHSSRRPSVVPQTSLLKENSAEGNPAECFIENQNQSRRSSIQIQSRRQSFQTTQSRRQSNAIGLEIGSKIIDESIIEYSSNFRRTSVSSKGKVTMETPELGQVPKPLLNNMVEEPISEETTELINYDKNSFVKKQSIAQRLSNTTGIVYEADQQDNQNEQQVRHNSLSDHKQTAEVKDNFDTSNETRENNVSLQKGQSVNLNKPKSISQKEPEVYRQKGQEGSSSVRNLLESKTQTSKIDVSDDSILKAKLLSFGKVQSSVISNATNTLTYIDKRIVIATPVPSQIASLVESPKKKTNQRSVKDIIWESNQLSKERKKLFAKSKRPSSARYSSQSRKMCAKSDNFIKQHSGNAVQLSSPSLMIQNVKITEKVEPRPKRIVSAPSRRTII